MTFIKQILTDLCKHNADNALDAHQRPGKLKFLLLVSLTIIPSGSAKDKQPGIKEAKDRFPGGCLCLHKGCFSWSPSYEMTFHVQEAIVH